MGYLKGASAPTLAIHLVFKLTLLCMVMMIMIVITSIINSIIADCVYIAYISEYKTQEDIQNITHLLRNK